MEKIMNKQSYAESLRKNIEEKTKFLKELPPIDTFVDFGCADGELLIHVTAKRKIGIEKSEELRRLAKERCPDCEFYEKLEDIKEVEGISILNCSGILHEIYTYETHEWIRNMWKEIKRLNFTYLHIRDFQYNNIGIHFAEKEEIEAIRNSSYSDLFEEYENHYGVVVGQYGLNHFLLKHDYRENWKREREERYFSFSAVELHLMTDEAEYDTEFEKQFLPEYTKQLVKDRFGIEMGGYTHVDYLGKKRPPKTGGH